FVSVWRPSRLESAVSVKPIWADLRPRFREARWRSPNTAHLRAFLLKATRNRFLDRYRQHAAALAHEQPLGNTNPDQFVDGSEPHPSAIAEANDLWERMLNLCSPAHRSLLILRRQGVGIPEIGVRGGMHEDSVRRILRRVARQAARQQAPTPPALWAES